MKFTDLSVSFDGKKVLDRFHAELPEHKITCVLGPSGCGKTTLLNAVSDQVPYTGSIEKASDKISYIFQNPTLLDHLTVRKNIELVLKKSEKDKGKRKEIAERMLAEVSLSDAADLYPSQLSGGMAQRVALARAFAFPSDILLADEPFRGLDLSLKKQIVTLFSDLHEKDKKTTLLVTHDIDEAILLADVVWVFPRSPVSAPVATEEIVEPRKNRSFGAPELRQKLYSLL